jgi:hypothetical protein
MSNRIYIKNVGSTQTMLGRCGSESKFEQMDWGADYDGNKAEIMIKTNSNGKKHNYHLTLDNHDLASMLNIENVRMPLHQRLQSDFKQQLFRHDPSLYRIELPIRPTPYMNDSFSSSSSSPLLEWTNPSFSSPFLSSPSSDEEFIIPVTLNPTTEDNFSSDKRRKRTHKTHRVFRRAKSSTSRRRSSRRSK